MPPGNEIADPIKGKHQRPDQAHAKAGSSGSLEKAVKQSRDGRAEKTDCGSLELNPPLQLIEAAKQAENYQKQSQVERCGKQCNQESFTPAQLEVPD